MAIEFRCPNCNKLLKTSDERAGARAKCPDCGTGITVPRAGTADVPEFHEEDAGFPDAAPPPPPPPRTEPVRYAGDTRTCPMCGEEIPAAAVRCQFCGETLDDRAGGMAGSYPTKIDAGEVISTSWEIFKSQMGIVIGGFILFVLITFAASILMNLIESALFGGAMGAGPGGFPLGRPGGVRRQPNPGILLVAVLFSTVLSMLVNSFFQAGWSLFMLKVAKGSNPEVGNLFGGGPYYLRMLGNSLLFVLMLYIGLLLCIIPGIIIALMFWPFQYVIVDDTSPHQSALSRAKDLTEGNWGAVILLVLASIAFNLLGLLACGIGLLFTIPLTVLMFAVAYCRMAGHRTAVD